MSSPPSTTVRRRSPRTPQSADSAPVSATRSGQAQRRGRRLALLTTPLDGGVDAVLLSTAAGSPTTPFAVAAAAAAAAPAESSAAVEAPDDGGEGGGDLAPPAPADGGGGVTAPPAPGDGGTGALGPGDAEHELALRQDDLVYAITNFAKKRESNAAAAAGAKAATAAAEAAKADTEAAKADLAVALKESASANVQSVVASARANALRGGSSAGWHSSSDEEFAQGSRHQ